MTKIKDLPNFERPREKMIEKGHQNLKNEELLAILIRTGRKGKSAVDIAKEILKKYPGRNLLKINYEDLIEIEGVSQGKACTILAAIELVKRSLEVKEETIPVIRSVDDVVAQAVYMRDKRREHLMVIYLNARNEMIFKKPMFIGTQEDIDITKRIKEAGSVMGVGVIDHIIITKNKTYSFKEDNLI